jgi:acetyl esterase/lipase
MIAALAPFGLGGHQAPPPVSPTSSPDELLAFVEEAEQGFTAVFDSLFAGLAQVSGVTAETTTIPDGDGNPITLHIHRPADIHAAALPGVLHLHGGGMVMLEAASACYARWRDELAATGLVVVGVEFRNAGGRLGNHPFPAGLDDCAAALRWVLAHRHELGIGMVVVSGESGGGNLSLALALRAKREAWVDGPAGVYAMAPMIGGVWDKPAELPSQTENDGCFISCAMLSVLGAVYDPGSANVKDALCWPSAARDEDLIGLPPHVISVNELDPLRDEGLGYGRRLAAAGVNADARIVRGTCHAGDVFFPAAMPEVYTATIRAIQRFAAGL